MYLTHLTVFNQLMTLFNNHVVCVPLSYLPFHLSIFPLVSDVVFILKNTRKKWNFSKNIAVAIISCQVWHRFPKESPEKFPKISRAEALQCSATACCWGAQIFLASAWWNLWWILWWRLWSWILWLMLWWILWSYDDIMMMYYSVMYLYKYYVCSIYVFHRLSAAIGTNSLKRRSDSAGLSPIPGSNDLCIKFQLGEWSPTIYPDLYFNVYVNVS